MDWLLDTSQSRALRRGSAAVDAHLRRHAGESTQATDALNVVRHHIASAAEKAGGRALHVRLRWGIDSVTVHARAVDAVGLLRDVTDAGVVPPRLLDAVRGSTGDELGQITSPLPAPEQGGPDLPGTDGSVPHLELALSLPRETVSVPIVRHLSAQALRAFGVSEPDIDDVQVAITEACANVIKHAADADTYDVQIDLTADRCSITVVDAGDGFDLEDLSGDPDAESESGRGLLIMRALVDNVAFRTESQAGAVVHMVKNLTYDDAHPLHKH